MILGARILSTNLSGKTANITFLPSSGGTIDLGSQTIPFNYLNPNPYGLYQLYFAEYDYTYEVNIPQPIVENNQSFVTLSKTSDLSSWVLGTLNFSDLTAEVVSLNLDTSVWNIQNNNITNESGYVYLFHKNDDFDEKLWVFVDKFSNEIGTYSAITSSYNTYGLNTFGYSILDNDNGIFKFFDGTNLMSFEFDKDNQDFYLLSEQDRTTENRSVLIQLDTFSSNTYTIYQLNSSGLTVIDEYDYNFYDKRYVTFKTGKFILNFNYDTTTGYYTDIKILNQDDLSVLDTYTLSANTYINFPVFSFFGKNKVFIYFYDYSNTSIPYTIYYYNGDTDTSDVLIKNRGSEFFNNQAFYSEANSNTDIDSGSLFMMFWDSVYDSSYSSGYTIGYMDFVYIIDGSDTFTTYTYQDSGTPDKSISIYNSLYSKSLYTFGNNGDGNYSIITINEGGVDYFPIDTYPMNKPFDRWVFGDKNVQIKWSDFNFTGATLYLCSEGILTDSILFDKQNDWNYGYSHNVFYINNEVDSYYVNNSVSAFTPINYYNNYYNGYNYWNDLGHNDGRILLLNTQNGNTALLLENSFVTGTTLPINGGYFNFRIGKDKFMYVYNLPTWEGNIVINLYDFNFNLLNSYQTEFDDWNNIYSLKDRFVVQFYDNILERHITYLVSESSIDNITTYDYNWTQINDYYWD